MPGITGRTAYFGRLPNGRLRRVDMNLVNTDLGGMVEPSQSVPGFGVGAEASRLSVVLDTPTDDLSDNAVDRVEFIKEDELVALFDSCHSGLQTPRLY